MSGPSQSRLARQKRFHRASFFVQHATANMIVREQIALAQRGEQRGSQRLLQRCIPHIDVRIGRERTGLRSAVGVDMEEAAPCVRYA